MYTWVAIYNNGSYLSQYDQSRGVENSTEHIDRVNLRTFVLRGHLGPVLTIHLDPGDRFMYRRRVEMQSGGPGPGIGHIMIIKRPYYIKRIKNLFNDDLSDDDFVQHGFVVIQPLENWNIPTVETFGDFRFHPWWYPVEELLVEKQQVGQR